MLNEFNKPYDDCFFVHANASSFLNDIIHDHGYDILPRTKEINHAIFMYSLEKFIHHNLVQFKKNIEAVLFYIFTFALLLYLYFCKSWKKWKSMIGWILFIVAFCTLLFPILFVGHILMSDYVSSLFK
jgi:hypothetical protein